MQEKVYSIPNKELSISELEQHISFAKEKGADTFKAEWSGDPIWAFQWLTFYKTISEEELKQRKIKALEQELNDLKTNNI